MRTIALATSGALALLLASACGSNNPAPETAATPQSVSLLNCAERELFSRGYRVRYAAGNRLRLRAEQTLNVGPRRPIIMVEYDPSTQGLEVWGQMRRAATGIVDPTGEVTQVAWAVEDACAHREAKPD